MAGPASMPLPEHPDVRYLGYVDEPTREALRALANEGLVHIRRSRGAVVASPTADDIEHLILFRALVEGAAARLIAQALSVNLGQQIVVDNRAGTVPNKKVPMKTRCANVEANSRSAVNSRAMASRMSLCGSA